MPFKLETIKKRKDFLKSTADAERIFSAFFIIQVLKIEGQAKTRFGFTVTKKISKRAVVRNKIRRRLKEAVRTLDIVQPGYDIVVIARHKILEATAGEVFQSMKYKMKKVFL